METNYEEGETLTYDEIPEVLYSFLNNVNIPVSLDYVTTVLNNVTLENPDITDPTELAAKTMQIILDNALIHKEEVQESKILSSKLLSKSRSRKTVKS